MSRAALRTVRSACRCRTRVSSDSSAYRFGIGRSAFAASCHLRQDGQLPRLEEITRPRTKTKSPRSTSAFQSASASSPTSASDSMTCRRTRSRPGTSLPAGSRSTASRCCVGTPPARLSDDVGGLLAGLQVPPLRPDLAESGYAAPRPGRARAPRPAAAPASPAGPAAARADRRRGLRIGHRGYRGTTSGQGPLEVTIAKPFGAFGISPKIRIDGHSAPASWQRNSYPVDPGRHQVQASVT